MKSLACTHLSKRHPDGNPESSESDRLCKMRGQRAPSLWIFLLDKQDSESIFTPRKLAVIPWGAGGTHAAGCGCGQHGRSAAPQTARHQHIPHCTLGRAFAHWGNASKKGNVMAVFHKRKLCRYVLKYLRERALIGSERFLLKKEKGDGPARVDLFSLRGCSCLPCWQLEGKTKPIFCSKNGWRARQCGDSLKLPICYFPTWEALIPYLTGCAKMNWSWRYFWSSTKALAI